MKRSFFTAIATALAAAFLLGGCATTGAMHESPAQKPEAVKLPAGALSLSVAQGYLHGEILPGADSVRVAAPKVHMAGAVPQEVMGVCAVNAHDANHDGRAVSGCGYAYFLKHDGGWGLWVLYLHDTERSRVLYYTVVEPPAGMHVQFPYSYLPAVPPKTK